MTNNHVLRSPFAPLMPARVEARSLILKGAVIHVHSARVTLNKKGGNQHKIPYTMAFNYVHPPVDNVASDYYVDVPKETEAALEVIDSVEQAIALYLEAFRQKFQSPMGRKQRKIYLQYFQRYLVSQGHSMKLKHLTTKDGQGFIDSLVNHYNGLPLRPSEIKKYRSAIRSFSRFLYQVGLLEENIFLAVTKR